jgi:hypothetical protein
MGSCAFEIILVPVLWGTFYGIVAGMAIHVVMNAVEALVDWLGRTARSIEAVYRAARVAPRRTYRPAVRGALSRDAQG